MADADNFSMDELEQEDFRELPVVYTIPDMEGAIVRPDIVYKSDASGDLLMDVYYPADYEGETRLPAVIFVHGDASPEYLKNAKDWACYVSWGQLAAASGLIGITFNHRSVEMGKKLYEAAQDVDDLIRYVRDNSKSLGVNADALAIWTCSAGTPFGLRSALRDDASYIRCIVSYYGIADLAVFYGAYSTLPHLSDEVLNEFSAPHRLSKRTNTPPPMLIVRAGLDAPELNKSIDSLLTAAIAKNVSLDFMNHTTGHHAFDILDDNVRTHEIIRTTLDFMQTHLLER
jgi:acetyl esterase/lipase